MITLVLGSMKSSKSAYILDQMEKDFYKKKKNVLVRPETDNRDFFTRKSNTKVEAIFTKGISEIRDKLREYDCIYVDEGQFINDLEVLASPEFEDKEIVIAALSGDSDMEPWFPVSRMIPKVDYIKKLDAVCDNCHKERPTFTYYDGVKTSKVVVGNVFYKALCRQCYNKLTAKKLADSASE